MAMMQVLGAGYRFSTNPRTGDKDYIEVDSGYMMSTEAYSSLGIRMSTSNITPGCRFSSVYRDEGRQYWHGPVMPVPPGGHWKGQDVDAHHCANVPAHLEARRHFQSVNGTSRPSSGT